MLVAKQKEALCDEPLFSFVIPARNEAAHIGDLLGSIAASDYPLDAIEVIVVDGLSTDGTGDIARSFLPSLPLLRVMDNPKRITPAAFNIGVNESSGEFVAIISAHSTITPSYVSNTVRSFRRLEADCVGGRLVNEGSGFVGRVLAALIASPLVVGNARFRYSNVEGPVDTVMGTYRRSVFDRIGLFDERLLRNQDNEFNARLRGAGGVIYLVPELEARYRVRKRVRDAIRQFFGNGRWAVYTSRIRHDAMSLRHFVPAAFVVALVVSALIGSLTGFWWLVVAVVGPYALLVLLTASVLQVAFLERIAVVFIQPLLHLSYGLGTLTGLVTRPPTAT